MEVNRSDSDKLTAKQEKFIAAMIAGNSILASAKIVGIGETTAHAWLKLPFVQCALDEAKQKVYDDALSLITDNVEKAIKIMQEIASDTEVDASVRLRASFGWIEQAQAIKTVKRLEARTAALEDQIRNKVA